MPYFNCRDSGHGRFLKAASDPYCPTCGILMELESTPFGVNLPAARDDGDDAVKTLGLHACGGCARQIPGDQESCPVCVGVPLAFCFPSRLLIEVGGTHTSIMTGESVRIGRAGDCDIIVLYQDFPYTSRHHLTVLHRPLGVVLTDTSSNGTWRLSADSDPARLTRQVPKTLRFGAGEECRLLLGGCASDKKYAECSLSWVSP